MHLPFPGLVQIRAATLLIPNRHSGQPRFSFSSGMLFVFDIRTVSIPPKSPSPSSETAQTLCHERADDRWRIEKMYWKGNHHCRVGLQDKVPYALRFATNHRPRVEDRDKHLIAATRGTVAKLIACLFGPAGHQRSRRQTAAGDSSTTPLAPMARFLRRPTLAESV
jgi:hypothetical protein